MYEVKNAPKAGKMGCKNAPQAKILGYDFYFKMKLHTDNNTTLFVDKIM